MADAYRAPDIVFGDPANRPLKVICIGAGIGGIFVAHALSASCSNVELTLYERQKDVGGVWQANRFPNAHCDIPSHNYGFPFAPKPDWDQDYASSRSQQAYMREVCDVLELTRLIKFKTDVLDCTWIEHESQWQVTVRQNGRQVKDTADVLVSATGIFSNPRLPQIPGLQKFKGRILHTSQWPSDYQQDKWADDVIAVVGNGATAVQTVPGLQTHANKLEVFFRSGIWFLDADGYTGTAKDIPESEKAANRTDPTPIIARTKAIEDGLSDTFQKLFISPPEVHDQIRAGLSQRISMLVNDERLAQGLIPDYPLGCRRPAFADPFLNALKQPNVTTHFMPVTALTEDGVIGSDGIERKVDSVVFATGFTRSHIPTFSVHGRDGKLLSQAWARGPKAYMGMTIPGFPNLLLAAGPNYPSGVGGSHGGYVAQAEYIVQIVKKMQEEQISSLEPTRSATYAFDNWAQVQLKQTLFGRCNSHYADKDTGRINAWPGAVPHYRRALRTPRYEDYNIRYRDSKNMFAYLGRGITAEHSLQAAEADVALDKSAYIGVRHVDPQWLAYASRISPDEARERVEDSIAAHAKNRAAALFELQAKHDGGSMLIDEPFRML